MKSFADQQSIQFIEFTTDDFDGISHSLEQLGLSLVATHSYKKIYLFENNNVSFIVNCEAEGYAHEHFQEHGPSILGIGMILSDPQAVLQNAKMHGFQSQTAQVAPSGLGLSSITGEGGVLNYPITAEEWNVYIMEEFRYKPNQIKEDSDIDFIDHIAINVRKGQLQNWKYFYEVVLNFAETSNFVIEGKKTSFRCNPMASTCGNIRVVLNEDFEDGSQISEFISLNNGSGVQHIALSSKNIYEAIEARRENSVKFMHTPDIYYELIEERIKNHNEDIEQLRDHRVLIDNDKMKTGNTLLQIFTDTMIGPIFFEIIQRKGNNGFGEGNVTTLFEAVEKDQIRRGVLA